jgi:hypothetical protein
LNTKDKTYLSKTADFSDRLPIKSLSNDLTASPGLKARLNFVIGSLISLLLFVLRKFVLIK